MVVEGSHRRFHHPTYQIIHTFTIPHYPMLLLLLLLLLLPYYIQSSSQCVLSQLSFKILKPLVEVLPTPALITTRRHEPPAFYCLNNHPFPP
jgi:hypothetical protein